MPKTGNNRKRENPPSNLIVEHRLHSISIVTKSIEYIQICNIPRGAHDKNSIFQIRDIILLNREDCKQKNMSTAVTSMGQKTE